MAAGFPETSPLKAFELVAAAVWDILHELCGNPLLPFDPTSSLGWASCDPVIGVMVFCGRRRGFRGVVDRAFGGPFNLGFLHIRQAEDIISLYQ